MLLILVLSYLFSRDAFSPFVARNPPWLSVAVNGKKQSRFHFRCQTGALGDVLTLRLQLHRSIFMLISQNCSIIYMCIPPILVTLSGVDSTEPWSLLMWLAVVKFCSTAGVIECCFPTQVRVNHGHTSSTCCTVSIPSKVDRYKLFPLPVHVLCAHSIVAVCVCVFLWMQVPTILIAHILVTGWFCWIPANSITITL